MCQRIVVMYLGRIVEEALRDTLFTQALHPYTQALLASIPSHNPTQNIDVPPLMGELPSPLQPPSGCHFHPRCPKAMDICRNAIPAWKDMGLGHKVRCHLTNI